MAAKQLHIYIAARYGRREEMCEYRRVLEKAGHVVTSRWLDGSHQISDAGMPIGDDGVALVEADDTDDLQAFELRNTLVRHDLEDMDRANVLLTFTESPRSSNSRGGRHVEYGYMLAKRKSMIVVGYRENLFHYIPWVHFAEDWARATYLINMLAHNFVWKVRMGE